MSNPSPRLEDRERNAPRQNSDLSVRLQRLLALLREGGVVDHQRTDWDSELRELLPQATDISELWFRGKIGWIPARREPHRFKGSVHWSYNEATSGRSGAIGSMRSTPGHFQRRSHTSAARSDGPGVKSESKFGHGGRDIMSPLPARWRICWRRRFPAKRRSGLVQGRT